MGQSRARCRRIRHLDRLWDYDPAHPNAGRIELSPGTSEHFARLRDDGKPAFIFAAHLGNWELPALAAAAYGLDTAILYRAPNIVPVAEAVRRIRTLTMGTLIPTGIGAPAKAAAALKRGAHFAMLVDQFYYQGTEVTFFGRRTKANPMIARLARHFECPIHGTRVVRLPEATLPHRAHRGDRAAARCGGADRGAADHAADHLDRRGLDPRASGAMAVAAPAVAVRCRECTGGPSRLRSGRLRHSLVRRAHCL